MVSFLRRLRRRRPSAPAPAPVAQDPDVEAATAAMRALHYRAMRMRRQWLGPSLSAEQRIAAAESELVRDSSRRRW